MKTFFRIKKIIAISKDGKIFKSEHGYIQLSTKINVNEENISTHITPVLFINNISNLTNDKTIIIKTVEFKYYDKTYSIKLNKEFILENKNLNSKELNINLFDFIDQKNIIKQAINLKLLEKKLKNNKAYYKQVKLLEKELKKYN